MENLEALFIKVVQAGSFKAAAHQLNTDPSSVSRKISALEDRLQVKLFHRSTRNSHPTEAGQKYYRGMLQILDQQAVLESQLTHTNEVPEGLLRVAAPHDFGTEFVSPVLTDMLQQAPNLSVELKLGSHYEDLKSQGIDVAVRIGTLADSSMKARKIGDVPRVLVASPDYLQRHGVPSSHENMQDHMFIYYGQEHQRKRIHTHLHGQSFSFATQGRMIVNSVSAIRRLTIEGVGMHLGPEWAFKEALNDGRLVKVLPEYQFASAPLNAVYLSTPYVPAKIRRFIDLLVDCYQGFGFSSLER